MKKNILFVDDEDNVLSGLRRALHSTRNEWSMSFSSSGAAALEEMSNNSYDVIVSDMRMPNMNGVELLTQVKKLYPETLRIVLSGYSETELILNCINIAHQYLAKPAKPETLKSVINKSLRMKDLLSCPVLNKAISKIDNLPCLPTIYSEINKELSKEDSSLDTISELISQDIAMTAKLLQICNSAYFGIGRTIESPCEAVNFLGIDTIKSLILTIKVFDQLPRSESEHFNLEKIWQQSQNTAILAKRIASHEKLEPGAINQSFTAGLLHRIGEIVLQQEFSQDYLKAVSISETSDVEIYKSEHEVFGFDSSLVGAYLLDLWGLPGDISSCLALIHQPQHLNFNHMAPPEIIHIAYQLLNNTALLNTERCPLGDHFSNDKIESWLDISSNI
ncbi:response regulator [uncultured Pseudoteredinibacter sp.]|uniref:response regulator n=1 Tax=uncultured Pseudoteredinibacter sp. TaxID=1641701 RepID=UPI0026227CD7|nr:response regulator [uncultured Pseudoteredinibacter sp.]